MKKVGATFLVVLVLFSGCARISIYQHTSQLQARQAVLAAAARGDAGDQERVAADFPRMTYKAFPLRYRNHGLVVDLAHECPKGWERLSSHTNFIQALLKVVTLNIVSSWTVEVECEDGLPGATSTTPPAPTPNSGA